MKKIIILITTFLLLLGCQDGPKAAFNDGFVRADPTKKLPFEKLVGVYKLDDDSKKRYKINDSISFKIILDETSISTNKYISLTNRNIINKTINRKFYYFNNYKEKNGSLFISVYNNKGDDFYNNIDIYYRKKDNVIGIYIYTPFIEASKENNMQFREGDYLRYIKEK